MKIQKLTLFAFLILALSGLAYYRGGAFISGRQGIYPYRVQQDLPFVLAIFKKNWHWLVAEGSTFDPKYTFTHLTPRETPSEKGKVTAYVHWVDDKPVGFIAYYMKNFYQGFIWFLVVDEAYRRLGISHKLITFALEDLKNRDAKSASLITRLSNVRAQGLYKKVGFKETWRDYQFVKFEKEL